MIKVMVENIRSKIKAFKEQKPQRYPCEYLFWGNYVKKVSENGLSYTYKHNECFLVDDINNPDYVIRLTGKPDILDIKLCIFESQTRSFFKSLKVKNGNVCYEIDIAQFNRFDTNSKSLLLEDIEYLVDCANERSKNRARQEAIVKYHAESELCK